MDHQWNYFTGIPDPRYRGSNRGLSAANMYGIIVNSEGRRFANLHGWAKAVMPPLLKQKKATQPLALASAGFVWKNPAGELASRLIEKAGLRGKRVNGAEISSKHANFIVNRGAAGAADILGLMELTRERVHSHFGITLETEIRILGE